MNLIKGIPPAAKKKQFVSLDVETYQQPKYKIHRPTGTFACLSVAMEGDENVYQFYDSHDVRKALERVNRGEWVIHNSPYDITQLRRYAPIDERPIWDTELVERNLSGGLYDDFSLKALVRRRLGEYMSKETRDNFETASEMTPEMQEYAALDAYKTLQIAIQQREQERDLRSYFRIDQPVIFPILDMPPIKIDVAGWTSFVKEMEIKAMQLQDELGINVNSPKQVVKAMEQHGYHVLNAQAATLEEYGDDPFVKQLLEVKTYRKAVSTYGMTWLEKHVEEGDLVYPSPHITGAETGRMSYTNPNLQNIPVRKMPTYRSLFIAKFWRMIISDITQQEPTILGFESGDPVLLAAIRAKEDLHQSIADAIHRDRSTGKVINLATSYGMTSIGLAKKLGISESEAETILRTYFSRFQGVFAWLSRKRREAYNSGYVSTVSGRRIWLNPHNYQWENNAINGPIQGGAADFTKMWVRKMWETCRSEDVPYSLVGIVHDEVLLDPPREFFSATKDIKTKAFHATAADLFPGLPFREETAVGRAWSAKTLHESDEDEGEPDDSD